VRKVFNDFLVLMQRRVIKLFAFGITAAVSTALLPGQTTVPPPAAQNPSPMVESSRAHGRVAPTTLNGIHTSFKGPQDKAVYVFVPERTNAKTPINIVIHFHGDTMIPDVAVKELRGNYAAVTMTLGAGSGVYDRSFTQPAAYDSLIASIQHTLDDEVKRRAKIGTITLVGFSAGHGAIRAILRDSAHFQQIHAVLLLDGMHTSYVPEGIVVEKGGMLDSTNLIALTNFARAAIRGEKRFIVTHSEIFPGTFASTTETADWIIQKLGLKRASVLRWGPNGMQQLSSVKSGRFELLGFAGNAGPDHIDQFHAMPALLRTLLK
jgi:hypothetical protein